MYHGDGDTAATNSAAHYSSHPAKGMEDEEAAGYLQARFMRARLNGKLQFSSRLVFLFVRLFLFGVLFACLLCAIFAAWYATAAMTAVAVLFCIL